MSLVDLIACGSGSPRHGNCEALSIDNQKWRSITSFPFVKDATQVNFSRKTALSTLREAIMTARHLFRPKNEVSKLFEKLNFNTMFMY